MNVLKDTLFSMADQADEIEQTREQLKMLAYQLERFEQHHDGDKSTLPSSYAQAMVVLLSFYERDEPPTLTDLVELLNIDKSNVTRLCQRMQEAGHVLVRRDERDRRAKRLTLTEEGVKLAKIINRTSLERFGELLGALNHEERASLLPLLGRLNTLLSLELR